jgi:hypothetical protein
VGLNGSALCRPGAVADREQDFDAWLIKLADAYVRFATRHSALIGLMFAGKHQAAAPPELLLVLFYAHAKPGCPVPRALSRAECQHRMTLRLMAVFHARLELDTRWLASRAGISRCPALSELISYLTFPRAALRAALG